MRITTHKIRHVFHALESGVMSYVTFDLFYKRLETEATRT